MLLVLFRLLAAAAVAQGTVNTSGTYQLMTIEPKVQEVFTTDLHGFIEANRQEHRSVLLRVGTVTWVRILARDVITAPGFQPLPEEIIPVDPETIERSLQRP